MRSVSVGFCAFVLSIVGCSSSPEPMSQPRPAEGPETEASPTTLSSMIVLRPSRGLELGDTVAVDLEGIDDDGRAPRYVGGKAVGTISASDLGPVGTGMMVVTASRLNVRRCRSTGCSVLGYVVRDQVVEASDFAGRWYRVRIDEETTGYAIAEHLQLVQVRQFRALAEIRHRTAEYYRSELERVELDGTPIFTGYEVSADDAMLSFVFKVAQDEGEALSLICGAMRGIAEFVRESMASYPPYVFPAYSAGVYPDSAGSLGGADMIAGLTGDDGVYCRTAQ